MYLTAFTALLVLTQWVGLSSALTHHNHIVRRQSGPRYNGPKIPSYNMSIPVDHFTKSDTRTYNNRYWVNDTYWKAGGPVFFQDAGESGVTEQWAAMQLGEVNSTSAVMRLAAKYNGIAVLFEHRYYGLSFPIPRNKTTHEPVGGLPGYKYLTVEQALEDVVYFAKNWKPAGCTGDECTAVAPSKAPWVWLGGSYPGVRGALIRIRNPEIFQAVWAASAPVEAVYDGSIYYNSIDASLPSNCSADIRAAVKYADEVMAGKYGSQAYLDLQRLASVSNTLQTSLNRTYSLTSTSYWGPYQIGRLMASVLTADFQAHGPTKATNLFCTYIQSYNPTAQPGNSSNPYISVLTNPGTGTISTKGIAATYNSSVAMQAYFYAYRRWYEQYYKALLLSSINYEYPPDYQADEYSWLYQVMTEFGWFQGSNPANVTIVSKFYNYTAVQKNLGNYFYSSTSAATFFPAKPNITSVNAYGGWNMKPSNVMFTEGQFDPWRSGSVMSNQPWIDAPVRNVVQTVPECGKPPSGTDVFGLIYPGEVHVPDLLQRTSVKYDSSSPVYQGVELFSKALDVWLPCFQKS